MDIKKYSTKQLLAELKKRAKEEPRETKLVIGAMGSCDGKKFVEQFKKADNPKDIDWIDSFSMRARLNSHRNYLGFYFKTDNYNDLLEHFEQDNEDFADWVSCLGSVKYFQF